MSSNSYGFAGCYDCGDIFAVIDLYPIYVSPIFEKPPPDGAKAVPANVCEQCLDERFVDQEEARMARMTEVK